MFNVLIVYAVEEERVQVNMPNCNFHYCKTGVGKVAASIAVSRAIDIHHPDVVLNIGTAGSVEYEIGSVHICCKFVDRDMEKLQNFGVPFYVEFTDEVERSELFDGWNFDSVCNSGDTFLTSADGTGDVFEMESFAVARICEAHQIPFVAIKCVTDIIGQNSIQHWEEKLAEAQAILQVFINENKLSVPQNYIGRFATDIIKKLDLKAHPEGGWYKEIYRSELKLLSNGLPSNFTDDRSALTSIHYLLCDDHVSKFHKIKSPEVWYFHKGMPLLIHIINSKGEYHKVELSESTNGCLQYTVEPNSWFGAEIKGRSGFCLVSCAVSPGFEFDDFEIAERASLLEKYASHRDVIHRLT